MNQFEVIVTSELARIAEAVERVANRADLQNGLGVGPFHRYDSRFSFAGSIFDKWRGVK